MSTLGLKSVVECNKKLEKIGVPEQSISTRSVSHDGKVSFSVPFNIKAVTADLGIPVVLVEQKKKIGFSASWPSSGFESSVTFVGSV